MNNATYLTLFEEARLAYFGKRGLNLLPDDQRFPFTLLNTFIRFVSPGVGGKDIIVKIKTVELKKSAFTQEYKVTDEETGKVWCEGKAVLVAWDVEKKSKAPMSKIFKETIEQFEGIQVKKEEKIDTDYNRESPLKVGHFAEISKIFGENEVKEFSELSEDRNPIHLDNEYAKSTKFGKKIVHGALYSSLISALLGTTLPGKGTIYLSQSSKYISPCYLGEKVTARVEVIKIHQTKPIVTLKTTCRNSEGKMLMDGEAVVMVEGTMVEIQSKL